MTLAEMLGPGVVTRADIAAHLDRLEARMRIAECVVLSKEQQKRLWKISSAEPGEIQELVDTGGTAVFAGRNSLRFVSRFEKRFAHRAGAVIGYNQHRLSWLTGPGYFTAAVAPCGFLFDYREVPTEAPAGWPRVSPNTQGFAGSVYGGLLDDVVWVARDVLIGSARRGDIPLDSYFVLARA
ncbi:MAG TPA: hypothetical protein VNU27_06365 [Candidatus Acidoferrum sp.]|nr:hypothetical protein [Candidatus Acidoferrum sp.]